jgi:hypothetical protein
MRHLVEPERGSDRGAYFRKLRPHAAFRVVSPTARSVTLAACDADSVPPLDCGFRSLSHW